MTISSLGVGNNILTQNLLDQLRKVDESARITPITLALANEKDKTDALGIINSRMTNLVDSITALKTATLWNERLASVTSGSSVAVTAATNTDLQDFTLNVINLATKQIEESGTFTSDTELIAPGMLAGTTGSMNINIDGLDFAISYDSTTTLRDLKNSINDIAGTKVNATIVQLNATDFRLFVSSVDTGIAQNITMTDTTGDLGVDTRLTTGTTAIQSAVDANFTFNGQSITRSTNNVTDLITGLDITLKEVGLSNVNITQDRTSILNKFDSFVNKYNEAIAELDKMTKSSAEADTRGIFSSNSTVKDMKRIIRDMMDNIGGGVGSMINYGFSIDKDGVMSLNKTVLEAKLDTEPANTQAFFSGGDYKKADLTIVTLTGAFKEMSTIVEGYTHVNRTLDQLKDSFSQNIISLNERKTTAIERLDARYETMKKQFTAYGLMISKINSLSSMFGQIANTQTSSQNY